MTQIAYSLLCASAMAIVSCVWPCTPPALSAKAITLTYNDIRNDTRKDTQKSAHSTSGGPSRGWQDALASLKKNNYAEALDKLSRLPPSESRHYYRGLCYQYTNQLQSAKSEYMWVYVYGKNARLKFNAWLGLNSVGQYEKNRTYAGQGNNFSRVTAQPMRMAAPLRTAPGALPTPG